MNSEIYSAPVGENLKPITTMSESDLDEFKKRLDFVAWVYNRTFVELDEEAWNRMVVCVCASIGFDGPTSFNHQYVIRSEKDNIC